MFTLDLMRRSSRSLLSAKTRTVLTAFAIAVGTFALTLTLAVSNGAQSYADMIIKDNFDPSELIITNDDSIFNKTDTSKPQVYDANFGSIITRAGATQQVKMLNSNDISRLQKVGGVESVRPAIELNLQYLTREGQKKYVATTQAYSAYKAPDLLAGKVPAQLSDHTIILPQGFLEALGFKSASDAIGKNVILAVRKQLSQASIETSLNQGGTSAVAKKLNSPDLLHEENFKVIAVTKKPSTLIQPGTGLYLNISGADVQRLNDYATENSNSYHKYLTAYLKVKDGNNHTKLLKTQADIKKLGYGAQSILDTEKTITQVIKVLQGIVTVFGLIAVVASVFGVVNTMYISVLQRTREIGLMKALGMHKKDINRLFLFEAALIGLLGGILGSALALGLGTALNPAISKKLGLGDISLLKFRVSQIFILVLVLVFVAILAGLFPARKASKLNPIEALRVE